MNIDFNLDRLAFLALACAVLVAASVVGLVYWHRDAAQRRRLNRSKGKR